MNKEISVFLKEAVRQGWKVREVKDGHQLLSPCGKFLNHIHSHHNNGKPTRVLKSLKSAMKRAGFIV